MKRLLAALSGHQSCAINLCTPFVKFPVCAERRDESGVDGQLRTVRNGKSLVDPGRECQPDPDLAGTHMLKVLLLHDDTRELLQTSMHDPVSLTHLQTHNLHGDGQSSREDGHTSKNGKTREEEVRRGQWSTRKMSESNR